jgi:hypothetical protein
MTKMIGSEKQIAWAEDIRRNLTRSWEELKAEMEPHVPVPSVVEEYMQAELSHDEAKYYIDHWRVAGSRGFTAQRLRMILEDTDGEVGEAAWDWNGQYLMKKNGR